MSKLKNVNEISIAWNNSNASVISKTLGSLGYGLFRQYENTSGWNYLSGSDGIFNGSTIVHKNHFNSIEDFLNYHFSEEKTPLEVEFEELQAQIKELSDKAAEIKSKLK